jgi:hypothetical protein
MVQAAPWRIGTVRMGRPELAGIDPNFGREDSDMSWARDGERKLESGNLTVPDGRGASCCRVGQLGQLVGHAAEESDMIHFLRVPFRFLRRHFTPLPTTPSLVGWLVRYSTSRREEEEVVVDGLTRVEDRKGRAVLF